MLHFFFKNKTGLCAFAFLAPICALVDVGLAYIMKIVIDFAIGGSICELPYYVLLCVGYVLLNGVITLWFQKISTQLICKVMISMKEDFVNRIISQSSKDFNRTNTAAYISNMTSEINILENSYFKMHIELYTQMLQFIISTVLLFVISPVLGAFVIVFSLLQVLVPILLGNKLETKRSAVSEKLMRYTVFIKELFEAFNLIKGFHIRRQMLEFHTHHNAELETSKYKSKMWNSFANILSFCIGNCMYIGTFVLGAVLTLHGEITVGTVIAASQLMVYVASPLTAISEEFSEIRSSAGIIHKFKQLSCPKDDGKSGNAKKEFTRTVEVCNLSFSYDEGTPVLEKLNLSFEMGKKYYIVGRSGCGKSTLVNILSRMQSDYEGTVTLDGQDINAIIESDFYRLVTINQQFPFIFDDTIRNNICLYKSYSDDKVLETARQAGIYPLIERARNGLDMVIGENAAEISGGEKQRISIARALINTAPILIMDESTSSLDNQTATEIEHLAFSLDDVLLIFVSHRLNQETLALADQIIVLDSGKAVEQGTLQELLDKKGYLYSLITLKQEGEGMQE